MESASGGGGGSEGDRRNPAEGGEPKVKRKMKTAFQLETLEKTYAVETYPSEALRAELSAQLGLTDRQLQMWFCHRRLKDRKAPPVKRPKKEVSGGAGVGVGVGVGDDVVASGGFGSGGSGSGSSLFGHSERFLAGPGPGPAPGPAAEVPPVKRYYEPPQAVSELRAIGFVEAQLGERIREDGPILGMEFDPLPPGAFGAPIVQQKLAVRPYEAKLYERPEAKPVKGSTKALHEYQFLPQQPAAKTDVYERTVPSPYYGSPADVASTRPPVTIARPFTHGPEQVPSGYGFQGPVPGLSLLPQQARPGGHLLPSSSGEFDTGSRKSSIGMEAHVGPHPITELENPFTAPPPPERRVTHEEEVSRLERKRKSEEARIAKEVEAHEKRIRKELEKQDMLRRKREEQMRKEMERQDRERRKEEERLLREKQREEERYQREQRREMERRMKFLQKESIRAEKLRLKEDMRREKEAARLKAANDRAAARRIAKESMELIDDERLELMEMAAASKGLHSMLSFDSEALQNLESLRDMLPEFPPESVRLKRPFKVKPWTDSEENVGNLLMVWKFLITFADVLGLWPFTLDEFVQAFHDHDPRLLGEIHVALLRSVIKDIEDVARASSASSFGANQTGAAANPGGGHPQIVEGAFAWGFDICSWQRHLSPLTWPEILRQFALAAGYGPKLKKRNVDQAYPREENEGADSRDVIESLRSGAAAANALAVMQERGFSNRRSRHRLTPGTVKYAAFHVLSLEGGRGLSILDVADKIQKSGLRDLTTSKTPEASIAAALSRDTKLFERTAPSTYCLRSPYRKDPADGEAIIAAARERIQVFKNGYFDGEEAFDAEKDDDSESDVAEDPEVDDIGVGARLGPGPPPGGPCVDGPTEEDAVVDESNSGEAWVQGLTEGEYSDLSVEERLDALVALIAAANEGNLIRTVLEERLEAATALKKQMWAEAQVDKRRIKDEFVTKTYYPSVVDDKIDLAPENLCDPNEPPAAGGFPTPEIPGPLDGPPPLPPGYAAEKSRSQLKALIGHKAEEMYVYRSLPLGLDRRRNRYWQFITCASRNDPGCGRVFVELRDGRWRLVDCEESFNALMASLDVRGNREAHLHSMLQRVEAHLREAVNRATKSTEAGPGPESPSSSLSVQGPHLPDLSSSFAVQSGQNRREMNETVKRYGDFEKWMWAECLGLRAMRFGDGGRGPLLGICDGCCDLAVFEGGRCSSCRRPSEAAVGGGPSFALHVSRFKEKLKGESVVYFHGRPVRFRLIKAQLALIESSIPIEALDPLWTDECRRSWSMKLLDAATAQSLLEASTLLEGAVRREFLSLSFETTAELLGSGGSVAAAAPRGGAVAVLPWLPETTASVALRLMELDASIYYLLSQKEDAEKNTGAADFLTLPMKYAAMKNGEGDHGDSLLETGNFLDPWADPGTSGRGRGGRGRGRGRARGGRSAVGSRPRGKSDRQLAGWKGRSRGGGRGGRRRGRRGVCTKPPKAAETADAAVDEARERDDSREFLFEESPVVGFRDWDAEETADLRVAENESSSDYEAENGGGGNEYDDDDMLVDDGFPTVYDTPSRRYLDGADYVEEYEDDMDVDEDDEDEQAGVEVDVDGFFNDDSDENRDVTDGGQIGKIHDDESEPESSSGYSD